MEKRHEVHLITHTDWKPKIGTAYYVGPFQAPKGINYGSINQLVRISSRTKQIIKEIKPDVVHAHYIQDSGLFAALSGFHPLIITPWGSDILVHPIRNWTYRMITAYVLRKADVIHSIGNLLTRKIMELGADPNKIITVPDGVDVSLFNPEGEALEEKDNLVISNRNLRPVYNLNLLIRAIPHVIKEMGNAEFIIGGDGEERESLLALACSLGVDDHLRFVGSIKHEDMPKWLRAAKVYVSTSLSDATSTSLLEAMATGIFPVVTNIEGNMDWVTDGKNGFLVPTDDPRKLASRIAEALGNDRLRESVGRMNIEIIRKKANWQDNMSEIEETYEKLAGQH
jgi:glycosyltransferase involved in cell wall biosynthesis